MFKPKFSIQKFCTVVDTLTKRYGEKDARIIGATIIATAEVLGAGQDIPAMFDKHIQSLGQDAGYYALQATKIREKARVKANAILAEANDVATEHDIASQVFDGRHAQLSKMRKLYL